MKEARLLRSLYADALSAVSPRRLVARALRRAGRGRPSAGGLGVFSAGKAAVEMARGVPAQLRRDVLVVAPAGAAVPRGWEGRVIFAGHPLPDRRSVEAAKTALEFFRRFGPEDRILALVSGGASSLLCLPKTGMTLAEKRRRIAAAMRRGETIDQLNRLRTSLSRIKGGRLADETPAEVLTLVLSDVPGEDPRLVGSGPTISVRKPADRAVVLASNRNGRAAAARAAKRRGLAARIERNSLSGEAARAGAAFAARLRAFAREIAPRAGVLIAGGETTVEIGGRAGRGGRAQEFALAAGIVLSGAPQCALMSAGSDGVDGQSSNAGAFADGSTISRARRRRLDPEAFLARHDSATFFERIGDNFRTGPTGTNVADWVFGVVNFTTRSRRRLRDRRRPCMP